MAAARAKAKPNLIIKILWGIIHHFVITILDYFIPVAFLLLILLPWLFLRLNVCMRITNINVQLSNTRQEEYTGKDDEDEKNIIRRDDRVETDSICVLLFFSVFTSENICTSPRVKLYLRVMPNVSTSCRNSHVIDFPPGFRLRRRRKY